MDDWCWIGLMLNSFWNAMMLWVGLSIEIRHSDFVLEFLRLTRELELEVLTRFLNINGHESWLAPLLGLVGAASPSGREGHSWWHHGFAVRCGDAKELRGVGAGRFASVSAVCVG